MKLKSLVFLLIIKVLFTQPPEDKIELPNYPYTKNTYGGYLEVIILHISRSRSKQ